MTAGKATLPSWSRRHDCRRQQDRRDNNIALIPRTLNAFLFPPSSSTMAC
jgi:hypothetical protein